MHFHLKGLHALLLSVVLAGCEAAPAPCLIQRVLLGGYTMRFDLKGVAPAGCEATLPQTFGDNWTFEAYPDGTVGVTSDRIQNGADPDPSHVGLGKGKLTATDYGRDHHPRCFSIWMAGGGVKPGLTHGASDELAMNVAVDPVHVHDFQATLLHLLGVDHERLTFRFQGRNFRLTDVHGRLVKGILA